MADSEPVPESELDRFRERWRAEVAQGRTTVSQPTASVHDAKARKGNNKSQPQFGTTSLPSASTTRKAVQDYSEEIEPKSYHDLPDKEEHLKLVNAGQNHDRNLFKEPETALEHYERAVEKENQGQLGDSLKHYRQAFKLDDAVDQVYKKKHFPVKPKAASSNTAPAVPDAKATPAIPSTIQTLLNDFAGLTIQPPPPLTDVSPPQRSHFAELPEEIVINILTMLACTDVAHMSRMAQVCKRLAFLVMTEQSIWRPVAMESRFSFGTMLYRYRCDINGKPFQPVDLDTDPIDDDLYDEAKAFSETLLPSFQHTTATLSTSLMHTTYAQSWRQMFRSRPRIRFDGCYISTVAYTRPGASNTNTLTWGVPVHVVTYFRYLRFFRDGTAISLLTTAEPVDVVHHLIKENMHDHHSGGLPNAVMKDALKGRWRLTGPQSGLLDQITNEPEVEGDVLVETEGVISKYTYAMRLALSHAGKGARNNKLAWRSFRYRNMLTDDWAGFTLKNDKAYYWSRVKSFALKDQ